MHTTVVTGLGLQTDGKIARIVCLGGYGPENCKADTAAVATGGGGRGGGGSPIWRFSIVTTCFLQIRGYSGPVTSSEFGDNIQRPICGHWHYYECSGK